ncbi:MAG: fibronectin type III domain-containing protein [Verrucomicrobiota bacterium]
MATDMANGLHELETALGIKQNTEAVLRAAIDAASTGRSDYAGTKSDKKTQNGAVRRADANMRVFLKAARAVLTQRHGYYWNLSWEETGWPDRSTAIPTLVAKRMHLCTSLDMYFTKNPTHEVAEMGVTAAKAKVLFEALAVAREGRREGSTASGQKKITRNAAMKRLRMRMRGLVSELALVLDPLDPRWNAFGLVPPGLPKRPEVPAKLTLTANPPGVVEASWAHAPRTKHYRVFIQIIGEDAEFRHLFNREARDARIPDLPIGKTVKVCVSAVNDAGESQPSEAREIVVG